MRVLKHTEKQPDESLILNDRKGRHSLVLSAPIDLGGVIPPTILNERNRKSSEYPRLNGNRKNKDKEDRENIVNMNTTDFNSSDLYTAAKPRISISNDNGTNVPVRSVLAEVNKNMDQCNESPSSDSINRLPGMYRSRTAPESPGREKVNREKELLNQPLSYTLDVEKKSSAAKTNTSLKKKEKIISCIEHDILSLFQKSYLPLVEKGNLSRRENIILELLQTEQTYVIGLEVLIKGYFLPLKKIVKLFHKLSDIDIDKIFGNIEQLLLINTQLRSELEERIEHWEETGQDYIGTVLLKWAPRLKPYSRFSSNFEDSYSRLGQLKESNSTWRKVLDTLEQHIKSLGGSLLTDYFITPVQRIPRYVMLIADLKQHTSINHPDNGFLTQAFDEMSSIASAVNEYIRMTQNQTQMYSVLERGKGFERLLSYPSPHNPRNIVRFGEAMRLVDIEQPKKGGRKVAEIFLFNDILVAGNFVGKKVPYQDFYQPLNIMWITTKIPKKIKVQDFLNQQHYHDLNESTMNDPVELTLSPTHKQLRTKSSGRLPAIYIRGPETSWIMILKDLNERDDWYKSILHTMKSHTVTLRDVANGKRKGDYCFKNGNSYSGEWYDGWMHGSGRLISLNDWEFTGHWNNTFRAGYGKVYDPKKGQTYTSGWKEFNGQVKATDVHGLWMFGGLTDRDWRIMLTGAQHVQVKAQEKIIGAGTSSNCNFLCKILSGKIRIEKMLSVGGHQKPMVTYVEAPTVVGDMSLVCSSEPADIFAETDIEMEIQSIASLLELFHYDPGICMRFFQALSKDLAEQMVSLRDTSPQLGKLGDISHRATSRRYTTTTNSDNNRTVGSDPENIRRKFSIPFGENLIDETECILKTMTVLRKFGKLYLFPNFLCFECSVFGLVEMETIQLNKISSIKVTNGSLKIIIKGGKHFVFLDIPNVDNFSQVLTNFWNESTKKGNISLRNICTFTVHSKPNDMLKLSQKDWDLILSGAQLRHYQPGQIIIQEGAENGNIYQIAKGYCDVKKKVHKGGQELLAQLNPGTLFGELTFLESITANASVIARTLVSVYIVEGNMLNILFVCHPQLSGRFYCYLASILASRLKEREIATIGNLIS